MNEDFERISVAGLGSGDVVAVRVAVRLIDTRDHVDWMREVPGKIHAESFELTARNWFGETAT